MIYIKYSNEHIKKLCTNEIKARKTFGKNSDDLFALLNAIDAASSLYDLVALKQYHLHYLAGDKKGIFAFRIHYNSKYRVEFHALDKNGNILYPEQDIYSFYKQITSIEIIKISEHYGK